MLEAMTNLNLHDDHVMEHLNKVLAQSPPIFRNFPPEDLNELLHAGEVEKYDRSQRVIDEIDPTCETAFLVLDGKVSQSRDGINLGAFGPGSFIEEIFLFGKGSRMASVIALEPTTVIKFRRPIVMDFFRSKPERLFTIFIINILDLQQRRIGILTNAFVRAQKSVLEHHSGGST
jgi:CRP-like cAMP-binding protein